VSKSIVFAVTNDISQDQRMHRICDCLEDNGYSVTLIGRKKKNSTPLAKHSFKAIRLSLLTERGFIFYLEYNLRLFFQLLRSSAEVYSAVDADTILAFRFASWITRKRMVFDAHELFSELPELTNSPIKKAIWNIIQKVGLMGKVDCYTVNEEIARILSQQYNQRFEVIHNFPKHHAIKKENKGTADPIQLVYVGMINKGRGVEQLIDFIKLYSQYELHLIGNGDLYEALKQKTEHISGINWYGFKHREEILELLPKFDIGLNLLSADSLNYYYSSANKFFDYVNVGLPVLTMDFPVYKRLNELHQVAQLIDGLEFETIKLGIDQIVENYTSHREQCKAASSSWNWEMEKEQLISIYQKT